MIIRDSFLKQLHQAFDLYKVSVILGPRQCGKTTLARQYVHGQAKENYFDLEDPTSLARLTQPKLALSGLKGLITIDEIQRRPELFQILRVLVDDPQNQNQFLILGSASRILIQQAQDSLAGRLATIELTPFTYPEIQDLDMLLLRGGFPQSYLASNDEKSLRWRKDYIRSFLQIDLPNLGVQVNPQILERFWMMLTHYHANTFNASEIGRSLSLSHKTIQHYLDLLTNTLMIRQLQPWFENISKRQVKSPKIYFRDNGLLGALLGITNHSDLLTHPKLGAIWEGLALEEIIRHHQADSSDCYFWATHGQAELDLLILHNNQRLGFEFKYSDAPKLSKSMQIANQDLKLNQLTVIYPGDIDYALAKNIVVKGLTGYLS